MKPLRVAILALLVGGCTVVVPDLHVTTVQVQGQPAAAQSFAPFPTDAPSPSPTPAAATRASFSGNGPQDRVGPVTLQRGRFTVKVRFDSTIYNQGRFDLQLLDREGLPVQPLLDATEGSFERTLQPSVDIPDAYYLSIPDADGAWTLDVESDGS